jgi:hypothetical protein
MSNVQGMLNEFAPILCNSGRECVWKTLMSFSQRHLTFRVPESLNLAFCCLYVIYLLMSNG